MAGETQLGVAQVPIRATLDKLDGDLNQARGKLDKALGGLGDIFKTGLGVASGIGMADAAQQIIGQLGDVVKSAAEAEEVQAALNQVLTSTGGVAGVSADMANNLAVSLQNVTRFEDETILGAETMLLRFKSIGKDVFPQATETTLDLATALKMDATSAAKLLGKALETPGEGLLKLKQAGVAFTDEQEKTIDAMVKAGNTAGAQKYILDALAVSIGGAAEAAGGTSAGKWERFQNVMGNIKEAVGGPLLTVLTALLEPLGELAQNVGPMVTEWGAKLSEWLKSEGIPAFKEFIAPIMAQLLPGLQSLGGTVMNIAGVVFPLLGNAFKFITEHGNIFYPILGWIAAGFLAMNAPIVAIIGAIVLLSTAWANDWGGIRTFIEGIWAQLQPALQWVWDFIQNNVMPILKMLWENYLKVLGTEVSALGWVWKNVLWPALQKVWDFIDAHILPIFRAIGNLIVRVVEVNVRQMGVTWNTILLPALTAVWDFIDKNILPIFQKIADMAKGPLGEALKWLKTWAIDPLVKGFQGMFDLLGWILDKFTELIDALANAKLPDWLTPGSPTPFELGLRGIARAMEEVGRVSAPTMAVSLGSLGGGGGSTRNYYLNYTGLRPGAGQLDAAAAMRELELYGRLMG